MIKILDKYQSVQKTVQRAGSIVDPNWVHINLSYGNMKFKLLSVLHMEQSIWIGHDDMAYVVDVACDAIWAVS